MLEIFLKRTIVLVLGYLLETHRVFLHVFVSIDESLIELKMGRTCLFNRLIRNACTSYLNSQLIMCIYICVRRIKRTHTHTPRA